MVNATRERKGRAEALKLARSVKRVVVGRGQKVVIFDMQKDPPDDATLAEVFGPAHYASISGAGCGRPTSRLGVRS